MEWLLMLFANRGVMILFSLGASGLLLVFFAWRLKKVNQQEWKADRAEWDIVRPAKDKKKPLPPKEKGDKV